VSFYENCPYRRMMMKKRYGYMFLALMAALCFGLAGCGDDEKGPGEGIQGEGIKEENGSLKITAQLYRQDESGATTVVSDYNGPIYVRGPEDTHYADGTISNGRIDITVPKPGAEYLEALSTSNMPAGIVISDDTAKAFSIGSLSMENGGIYYGYRTVTEAGREEGQVQYIYADKPVTMKGSYTEEGSGVISYDLNLKAGWNTAIITSTRTSSSDAYTGTMKSGNPSDRHKWILNDY
jgi:hypothetical protein